MATRLLLLSLKTGPDPVRIYELAVQTAQWTGLPVIEQIRFAAAVTESCASALMADQEIIFSIVKNDDGSIFLRADINPGEKLVEKELPAGTNIDSLPSFEPKTQEDWQQSHVGLHQSISVLVHDMKNSITKLKLSLSLVEEEKLPDTVETYMKIVYKAADQLQEIMLKMNKIIQDKSK